ncbi:hypothetical protein BH20ACI2_BH20ACI2_12800 [soil metagenome]
MSAEPMLTTEAVNADYTFLFRNPHSAFRNRIVGGMGMGM